jgi:hypothetical protein
MSGKRGVPSRTSWAGLLLGTLDNIIDSLQVGSLEQPEVRNQAFSWLAERVNTFVNVLRPRMRSLADDYQSRGE